MSEQILGGEVSTQFTYRGDGFADALAVAKAEQEGMCGYRLILMKSRETKMADDKGEYHEVFVTFGPWPTVSEAQLAADPSLRPPAVVSFVPDGRDATKI